MSEERLPKKEKLKVLVTGVTGYVGGRLVSRLLQNDIETRVLVRGSSDRVNGRSWSDGVEVAVGDVLKPETLAPALEGIDVAYYLIHSMSSTKKFRQRDKQAAQNFGEAAVQANVKRIIYLGGLGREEEDLSKHLRSRQETGETLRQYGIPVTEFRAGMVIGSGSLSFEMLRHLTERLPIMIAPKWLYTPTQPISIEDVLDYFVGALSQPKSGGEIVEIGGPDVLSSAEIIRTYAKLRGLNRTLISVPFLSPTLSSHWIHWVTPISAKVARPLVEGLENEIVVTNNKADNLFPDIKPMGIEAAIDHALQKVEEGDIETLWSDAISSSKGDQEPVYFTQEQGMLIERRERRVDASKTAVFHAFTTIGGSHGWPTYHWLWQIRGLLDRLVGGVGLRRGRRHLTTIRRGEALDFWRVEKVEPNHLLRLRAEMKLPGLAWLQFEAIDDEDGTTKLVQTAYFAPKGLFGLLYWYSIYPMHGFIFSSMIDTLSAKAVKIERENQKAPFST